MSTSNEEERRYAIDELRRQVNAAEEDMRAGLAAVPAMLDGSDAGGAARRAAVLARNEGLQKRIEAIKRQLDDITREVPADERDALAAAQARADSVATMLGERAPIPRPGETSLGYRRRVMRDFIKHSPAWREMKLDSLTDDIFQEVEPRVYADAQAVGSSGQASPGQLFPVVEQDAAGRKITRFYGDIMTWMAPHMTDGAVCRIIRPEYE